MLSDYAARFVWDLVGNPEDRFSDVAAHISIMFIPTVKFLNFGTPEIFAVIYLKFIQRPKIRDIL